MDPWLTDEIKARLYQPCLETAGHIGKRLDNRIPMAQSIDERALTEQFVDLFDTGSNLNVWSRASELLRDEGIYFSTDVRKSTKEYETGADLGIIIRRNVYQRTTRSSARYAVLVQCKKVDNEGQIKDFYHTVASSGRSQSSLLLDVTPSSFYFILTPPSLLSTYCSFEPVAFLKSGPGCSSPIWNMGHFGFDSMSIPFLAEQQKAEATGILVVPALAVVAQKNSGSSASLDEILPNAIPYWYWFAELLIPAFIGDYSTHTVEVAANQHEEELAVRHSLQIDYSTG